MEAVKKHKQEQIAAQEAMAAEELREPEEHPMVDAVENLGD